MLEPSPGSPWQQLALYQGNYFVRRWQSYQRRQIREALGRTLCEEALVRRWALCVPTRLAAVDVRWFDDWRKQQALSVEVLDGNELLALLKGPSGHAVLEQMQAWGVTTPTADAPQLGGRLRVSPADPNSGLTHYLYASVYDGGARPAQEVRVELAHSAGELADSILD